MTANELRLGNWILEGDVYQLDENSLIDILEHWKLFGKVIHQPVPLSEEWLLKFGFDKLNRDVPAYEQRCLIVEWLFERWTGRLYFDAYTSIQIIEIKYVHHLQNLYFALTGEELILKTND